MRLYALCDQDMLDSKGISLENFIDIAKENSAEIIQYRNKEADDLVIKDNLIKIKLLFNGILIVNDRYNLVQYCDGVHMGQKDLKSIDIDLILAVNKLRDIIGKNKILGISTHNKDEIIEANQMNLDYIGLGAYRTTTTKKDISVVIGDNLDSLALLSKHNVAVIGGVKLDDRFKNITYHVIGSGLL